MLFYNCPSCQDQNLVYSWNHLLITLHFIYITKLLNSDWLKGLATNFYFAGARKHKKDRHQNMVESKNNDLTNVFYKPINPVFQMFKNSYFTGNFLTAVLFYLLCLTELETKWHKIGVDLSKGR
jgi:hypothetical protein